MTERCTVTRLRQRMIEDMAIRRFGEYAQRDYVRQVSDIAKRLQIAHEAPVPHPDLGRSARSGAGT